MSRWVELGHCPLIDDPSKFLRVQTCQPTRLKRVRPAYEYKTSVTQNPRGSRFYKYPNLRLINGTVVIQSWHFLFRRGLLVAKTVKKCPLSPISLRLSASTFGLQAAAQPLVLSRPPLRNFPMFAGLRVWHTSHCTQTAGNENFLLAVWYSAVCF